MLSRIGRYWRVFGTGLSFVAVGAGGVLVFPVVNIFVRSRERRLEISRRMIKVSFQCIVGVMSWMGVFRYEISGLQRLERKGLLILANHPTLIDIVFLMAFVEHADCIVKGALSRNPFTHATIRAAAYIRNDDYGAQLIEDCVGALRRGSNLIVFPEGTRTPADGSIILKRGAANIAVRGLCNITPVVIRCAPPMLAKGEKWWRLPFRPSQFNIEVKQDLDTRAFIAAAGSEVWAVRRLTDYLQKYFTREQHHAER
jgi:1-acyl-sn-glycerol-3-phosphate acyltransferase